MPNTFFFQTLCFSRWLFLSGSELCCLFPFCLFKAKVHSPFQEEELHLQNGELLYGSLLNGIDVIYLWWPMSLSPFWFSLVVDPTWYCWWKKSCTSWYVQYPIIYRVLTIPGGAGFCPSTVGISYHHSKSYSFVCEADQLHQSAGALQNPFLRCRFGLLPHSPKILMLWMLYIWRIILSSHFWGLFHKPVVIRIPQWKNQDFMVHVLFLRCSLFWTDSISLGYMYGILYLPTYTIGWFIPYMDPMGCCKTYLHLPCECWAEMMALPLKTLHSGAFLNCLEFRFQKSKICLREVITKHLHFFCLFIRIYHFSTTNLGNAVCFAATKQANLRFRLIFLFVLGDHCEPDNNNHQHCAAGKEELCNPWKMSWHVPRGQSLSLKKRQMADYIVVWGILNTNSILLMVVTKIKWYSKTITGWWFQYIFCFSPRKLGKIPIMT